MAAAQVIATDEATNVSAPAVASRIDGGYTIPGLAAASYTVAVKAPRYQDAQTAHVAVPGAADVANIDFALVLASVAGQVTDAAGQPVAGAQVSARDDQGNLVGAAAPTDVNGNYGLVLPPDRSYKIQVDNPPGFRARRNVAVTANVLVDGIDFSKDVVKDFLGILDDDRFSLESKISEVEAEQAMSLFSVVNLMLAGTGQSRVGREEKLDMLGVLSLYYGLQDGSLRDRFTFSDAALVWRQLEGDLQQLAVGLGVLQADLDFLQKEAKRQFNLGRSNTVEANVQFPALLRRYVEIGIDPLLSLDIRQQEQNQFFDRTKLAQADDLLKELKSTIVQVVRSLSKYGTAATRAVNERWADFEAGALEVLATVAQYRVSPDQDDKNEWAVLSDLIGKNRDTEVAPYVVLARHGGKLLQYALAIYRQTRDQLDNYDRDHLRDLFQHQGTRYWTDQIRENATVIKRYPLANWG